MSLTVCVVANAFDYPRGGGVLWEYLNWALGFKSLGCRVIWLEAVRPDRFRPKAESLLAALKSRLETYGLRDGLALCSRTSKPLPRALRAEVLDLDDAAEADLMVNMAYDIQHRIVKRFRRSVFVDVDPGLTQLWMNDPKRMRIVRHDVYVTTGETVGQPGARFPDVGLRWQYTPPCVALDWWPVAMRPEGAHFTTVSQWVGGEWVVEPDGEYYPNNKRDGFLPFVELPQHTRQPLELALNLGEDPEEREYLVQRGWLVRDAYEVSSTPWDYQKYLQTSLGEFSCAKPSCMRLQNAWVSDRTICYLASGKPAVVQHTGPSRFLPDTGGMFRFHTVEEAARYLEMAVGDYGRQCHLARALAEEHFDAKKNLTGVLDRALA